jgi:hypothetical protein
MCKGKDYNEAVVFRDATGWEVGDLWNIYCAVLDGSG